ncbi:MAG: hypothetical protein JNK38_22830 [Acidobacteria bacterium]|nr:hypothetical protein [Acidobacteriota bacterium]
MISQPGQGILPWLSVQVLGTITIIIQKMRASRARIDALILQNMDLDATQYTFGEAEHDLRELFQAGTLQSGFLELAASAGNDATQAADAKKAIQARHTIPIATAEQRELSRKIFVKANSLEKKWKDNKNNQTGKDALEEMLKALNQLKELGGSAEPGLIPANVPADEDGAVKLIKLFRREIMDADTSTEKREKKMPALAKALGIN